MRRLLALVAGCVILLTGCSDPGPDEDTDTGSGGTMGQTFTHQFAPGDCTDPGHPEPLSVETDRAGEIDYLDDIVACTDPARSTIWLANNSDAVWELYLDGQVQSLTMGTQVESAFAATTGASTSFVPEATMVFSSYVPYEWHVNDVYSAMWVGFDAMKDEFQSWGEEWAVEALSKRTPLGAAVATCSLAFGDVIGLDFEKEPAEVLAGVFESASGGAACRASMAEVRYYDAANQEHAVLEDLSGLKNRAAVLDDVSRKMSYTNVVSKFAKFALRLLG